MRVKYCTHCGVHKAEQDFARNTARRDGLQSFCKRCKRAYDRDYYVKHRATVVLRHERNRKAKCTVFRRRVYDYLLRHPCVDCGERDPVVLDFDHVRGRKKCNISRLLRGDHAWQHIEREIAKCQIRCACCHRRITAKRLGHWRWLRSRRFIAE